MEFLEVLKIIGIVLGCLIVFIIAVVAIILSSPIFYKGRIISKDDDVTVRIKVNHIFRFVYGYINYIDDELRYYIRVLWEKISDDEDEATKKKRKLKKAKKKAKKRLKRMKKAGINPESVQTAELKSEEQAEDKDKTPDASENINKSDSLKEKKSVFKRLKSLYNVIKQKIMHYIANLKMVINQIRDKENQEAVLLVLRMLKQPVSFIINKKLKIRMKLGTDDPAKTGEMLGISYAIAALLGADLVIEPDFENEVFELDAGFKGHVSVFKVLIWVLELYSNEKIQLIADEIL